MKRTYTAPVLEAKEYAQLENVFTWCDREPNHTPECFDQSGSGNDADKNPLPEDSTAHKALGTTNPTNPTDPTVPTYGSVDEI